jgi:hypothetical protein
MINRPGPLRVYLDNSDFAEDADEALETIRGRLSELQRRRIIEVRFSGLHVREFTQTTPQAKPQAVQRAQVVRSLCGQRAFLSLDRLFPREALALIRGNGSTPCLEAYQDGGDWLTKDLHDFACRLGIAFYRGLENRVKAAIARVLKDRPFTQLLFYQAGHLTRAGVRIASRETMDFKNDWAKRFHFTSRFWRTNFPLRALRGKHLA